MEFLDPSKSAAVWSIREVLGLAVSSGLAVFYVALAKPSFFERARIKISESLSQLQHKN
jgi:hypothetical protein